MTFRLEPIIDGPADGETLVFLQGWPDDATMWDAQIAALSPRYRCVRTTMPNFGVKRETRWGYRTDEIVDALAAHIRAVSPGRPVTLVCHDWGAYWSYSTHKAHPDLAWRIIGVDVAPHFDPSVLVIAYQLLLSIAFHLGRPVGDWISRFFASTTGAPLPPARINSWMGYPYRNAFEDLLSGRIRETQHGYWPELPLLYVFGTKKPVVFHTQRWLDHVERHGEVHALDVGHWVHKHPDFNDILLRFLARTDAQAADSSIQPSA